MKKKLLALALSAVMMLGLSTTAFASTVTPVESQTVTATIKKVYTEENEGTTSPADTFKFTVENYALSDAASTVTVANMPTPSINDISVAEEDADVNGKEYTLSIELPKYESVGVYTYKVTEVDNKLAGVTYDPTVYYLKVVVIQTNGVLSVQSYELHSGSENGAKDDTIDNIYSAGELDIKKEVTGNLGDKTKYFAITVTLTGESDKTYATSYPVEALSYSVTSEDEDGNEVTTTNPTSISIGTATTFYIKDDETIKITNLPYGVTYTVTEAEYEGYTETIAYNDANTKIDSATDSVTVTNNKGNEVDTGINLDSLPYILILALVLIGAAYVITRRCLSDRY
ncbi:MAG: hypothetical protein LIO94_09165 [Clostridiales bacterium]|nr:hypothetical protein [Clostridiales bacterium]